MTRRIYALLVGINDYAPQSSMPPLKGCVSDIKAMQAYLEGRNFQAEYELHLRVLYNDQATRQAIINGFQ